jgi:hypothetical protein
MNVDDNIKKSILQRAERLLHYNNLLITQCDSWLSAEEGNRNMEKMIEERRKKEKSEKLFFFPFTLFPQFLRYQLITTNN